MDYEKKYNEALERAKEIKSKILSSHLSTESCKAVSEYINEIIPELAESEDERIRKWILEKVQGYAASGIPCSDEIKMADKAIDYLEKQKESTWTEEDESFRKHILPRILDPTSWTLEQREADRKLLEEFVERQKNKWVEKQKEQKPSDLPAGFYFIDQDGNKYYSKKFRYNNGTFTTTMKVAEEQNPDSLKKYIYSKDDKKFIQDCANILVANNYTASAERLLSMFEQKPAEWDEQDEKVYDYLKGGFEYATGNPDLLKSILWGKSDATIQDYRNFIDKLKILRPQPKQEWREEDEKILEQVIDVVYDYCPNPVAKYKLKDWLTQRLKSLRPSWKPSEEQMKELDNVCHFIPYNCDILESLYEQLKKLT